jgi:hypothetical protein
VGQEAPRWLLLRPGADLVRDLRAKRDHDPSDPGKARIPHVVDLREARYDREGDAPPPPIPEPPPLAGEAQPLVLLGLEARLPDPLWRARLLAYLACPPLPEVFVVTDINPLHWVRIAAAGEVKDDEVAAWAAVLGRYQKARFALPKTVWEANGVPSAHLRLVDEECRWSAELREIGQTLLRHPALPGMRREQVLDYLLDAASAHYRLLWSRCTEEEKLVLVQLAEEGVVSPRHHDVLRRLRRCRLVRTDPQFRIFNRSFRSFVLEAETRERIAQWESLPGGSGFERVRLPVFGLVAIAVGLLLFTQEAAFSQLLGVAGASVGALGLLRRVFDGVGGGRTS